ncbi:MAG TPA: sigma factor, partial [Planctomycetota bacterium]|nr:sigma factor [Planctomycetota bacterium]
MNSKKNPFDPDRCRRLRVSLRAAAEKALSQYDPRLAARFDPSDLVQDALLRAYLSIHTWRGSSEKDLFAWARRILDNVLANEIRAAMAGRRD